MSYSNLDSMAASDVHVWPCKATVSAASKAVVQRVGKMAKVVRGPRLPSQAVDVLISFMVDVVSIVQAECLEFWVGDSKRVRRKASLYKRHKT